MHSKLKVLQNICRFSKKLFKKFRIPEFIFDDEKIVRTVFSPVNVKNGELRPNAFRPPTDSDEISVSRLSYTTVDKIKSISKEIQNPSANRSYFGLALLYAMEIREVEAEVIYTPIKLNKYHSDIKIGHVMQKGIPLPAEVNFRINTMHKKARFYKDPNPNSAYWEGNQVE